MVGFTAAMVLGVAIASALWWWDGLYKVLDPYLVVANAMPKTAFVPIFYIWLGAALSVYGMSLAISLFITILMIYSGFQGIDPNKIKLAQTFGASKGQILAKVVLPGSVPTLIAALKVNAGLSLVGVVVGEFQSANLGLGYLIVYGSQILKMNIVMTAITILAIVSSLMYLAIAWLEAAVMRRRVAGFPEGPESGLPTPSCAAPPARAGRPPRRWSSRRRRTSGNCSATPHAPRRSARRCRRTA